MTKDICIFHSVCKGYRKESYTCNEGGLTEAPWYCGYWKIHKTAVQKQKQNG